MQLDLKDTIITIIETAIESYSSGFQARHLSEKNDPDGCINMKIHNVFIEALGDETKYYTSLVRSLDSSLGNMLEKLAMNIAKLNFTVKRNVEGSLFPEQIRMISDLLEKYKRRELIPKIKDYQFLRDIKNDNSTIRRHDSDYYLISKDDNRHSLIELKIGGDLDNKKARSEKEAILEQFAILSNTLKPDTKIDIYFATAYNRYGENKPWIQQRVLQYFSEEELLIGKDFWNFICKTDDGYELVVDTYKKNSFLIKNALSKIKNEYIGI